MGMHRCKGRFRPIDLSMPAEAALHYCDRPLKQERSNIQMEAPTCRLDSERLHVMRGPLSAMHMIPAATTPNYHRVVWGRADGAVVPMRRYPLTPKVPRVAGLP